MFQGLLSLFISVLLAVVFLFVVWMIVSVPVYISAKVVSGRKATFGSAMYAVLLGIILSSIVYYAVYFILYFVEGRYIAFLPDIAAFLALLAVYRSQFGTGWLGAFSIAVLSAIIWIVLSAVVSIYVGTSPLPFMPKARSF